MLLKTHVVITIFGILLLIPEVNHKLIFGVVALLATFIPDIDSRYSTLGRKKINRILQFFTQHRGITHSFILLILITVGLVFLSPVVALGFFLGYGLHLFADSFTRDGILPFYPFKAHSSGNIKTGGKIEIIIFVIFLISDIALFFYRFTNFSNF